MEDGPSHPQIVAILPPGPSDRNVNAMNSLGNLSDDVLLQTVARPPRTYLGAPGNPLAPQNRDSQAALWELSVIFTPEGPSGETWMCCARPREGAAGVENPFDPTGPKICGFIMVFRDPSNCNKHMRRHHSGEWASATVGRPTSLAGNARRQREVAAALGLQTQLPYMGNREREAHNERFVLMCALDLRPPHMNSHVGFQMFATGLNHGCVFVLFSSLRFFFLMSLSDSVFSPFPLVSSPRFRYVQQCSPHTFDNILLKLREVVLKQMREEFKKHRDSFPLGFGPVFSVQFDPWTGAGNAYLGISVSYVDEDFNLQRACLAVMEFPGSHTGETIAGAITNVTSDFFPGCRPSELFVAATSDSASNCKAAAVVLGVPHHPCDAHRLNTAVRWGMGTGGSEESCRNEPGRELIGRVCAAVAHFTRSPRRGELFRKVQEQFAEQASILEASAPDLRHVRHSATRWSGDYEMMLRVCELRGPQDLYFREHDTHKHLQLNFLEYKSLGHLCGVFADAMEVCTRLQGREGSSVSAAYGMFVELQRNATRDDIWVIDVHSNNPKRIRRNELDDNVAVRAQDEYAKELSKFTDLANATHAKKMCIILDLDVWMDLRHPDGDDTFDGESLLRAEYERFRPLVFPPGSGSGSGGSGSAPMPLSSAIPDSQSEGPEGMPLYLDRNNRRSSLPPMERTKRARTTLPDEVDEVTRYMAFSGRREEGETVFDFWRANRKRFPVLALLARKYLAIESTSCEVERVFSKSGYLLNKLRSCMLPWKVEAMMFVCTNKERHPLVIKFRAAMSGRRVAGDGDAGDGDGNGEVS